MEGHLIIYLRVYDYTTETSYQSIRGEPWDPSEPKASQGDLMSVYLEVCNDGEVDDYFKIELTGDVSGSDEFFLAAWDTHPSNFSFTMPNKNTSITINTYHLEEWGGPISP